MTAGQAKIVVVEDEPDIRKLLEQLLGSAGYAVVATSDPHEAVALVKREQPDLVLCDIAMPELDGYKVLEALQADPDTAARPVVFLTAHREFTERMQAFKFGVVDYITKPFRPQTLLRRLERLLAERDERTGVARRVAYVERLLDEARQERRSGLLEVKAEEGRSQLVVREGQVVGRSGTPASGEAESAFRELDPEREAIVAHDPPTLPGDASQPPSFDSLPPELRTVLIVEDNEEFRKFLRDLLGFQGFTVHEAATGEQGLELTLRERPWLILADVALPGMDGFEFCSRVRSHSLTRHTPLVFLSGWDDYKERYKGLEAGADEFLSKGTPVRELLIRIQLLLSRFFDVGRSQREATGMSGRLDLVGPPGVLQMCHLGRLSGVLTARSGAQSFELRFRQGEIVEARGQDLEVAQAVFGFLAWTRGVFDFRPGDVAEETPIGESFEQLLLEGCRRLDETRRA